MSDLDARLLAAHAAGDTAALARLYTEAAQAEEDPDARGFFLTQAYVFALELDHPALVDLTKRLKAKDRI